jgi:hypothetical protein
MQAISKFGWFLKLKLWFLIMSDYIDDEQLEEKKKILTLGDQAAFEQQAEVTRLKNIDILEHLKLENGDLRKQYLTLRRV